MASINYKNGQHEVNADISVSEIAELIQTITGDTGFEAIRKAMNISSKLEKLNNEPSTR